MRGNLTGREAKGLLTDEAILKIFKPHISGDKRDIEKRPENQFSLEDLVGCRITGKRIIKNFRAYNPEMEDLNPEWFLVLELDNQKYLLVENWEDGECSHREFYYYDGRIVHYAHELFCAE